MVGSDENAKMRGIKLKLLLGRYVDAYEFVRSDFESESLVCPICLKNVRISV